jgi:hypothetical protein
LLHFGHDPALFGEGGRVHEERSAKEAAVGIFVDHAQGFREGRGLGTGRVVNQRPLARFQKMRHTP